MGSAFRVSNRALRSAVLAGLVQWAAMSAGSGGELPTLAPGRDLQPGWQDNVRLVDDPAAATGKALLLALTPETGKETSAAYWNNTPAGQITRGPVVELEPGRRYRAWVRLRVRPNIGSSSAINKALIIARVPVVQAAIRLMLASKKSSTIWTRSSKPCRTISCAIAWSSSDRITT